MNRYTPTLIWLLACLIFCILNWRCASTTQDISYKARGFFTLEDKRDITHAFKQPIIMHHGESLTMYCAEHFEWEVIKAYWDPELDDYMYFVSKHKKSWKR